MRVRIEPEHAADRLAQRRRRAVRIILQMLGRPYGRRRSSLSLAPKRRLVRRQLEDLGDAGRAALARDVRGDVEHAGARLRSGRGHCGPQNLSAPARAGIRSSPAQGLLLGGNRIAGRVAADEGRRTNRGAGLNQGRADRLQGDAFRQRDQQGGAVEGAVGHGDEIGERRQRLRRRPRPSRRRARSIPRRRSPWRRRRRARPRTPAGRPDGRRARRTAGAR